MKIVLTCSLNYLSSEDSYTASIPLGLLSCAAVLEKSSFIVEIVDPNILISSGEVGRHNLYENLAQYLACRNGSVYGFSTFGPSYHQSLRVAEALKKKNPYAAVVFGGPQASLVDEMTVRHFLSVDVVVRGEGEYTLCELVKRLKTGDPWLELPGITFRSDRRIQRNSDSPIVENLDELPMPAWHLYPVDAFAAIPLDAVRGCLSSNIFSSCGHYAQGEPRFKSNRRLVKEIVRLSEILSCSSSVPSPPLSHGMKKTLPFIIELPHELFASDIDRLQQFCRLIRHEIPSVRWSCVGKVGALDENSITLMAESGCISVRYEVESGSSDIQRDIGTNYELIDIGDAITLSLQNSLHVDSSYTVGFPFEREEDVRHTFEMIRRTFLKGRGNISINCSLLVPHAGTQLYQNSREKLIYNGYRPERRDGGPYDRESVRLIGKYPEIFSCHYHITTKFLRRDVLEEITELMTVPMKIMPATALALWQEVQDPFSLYKDWKLYNGSSLVKERYKFDYLRGDGYTLFARVFSDFIGYMIHSRFLRTVYLADLAEYELTRFITGKKHRKRPMQHCSDVMQSRVSRRRSSDPVKEPEIDEATPECFLEEELFPSKKPIRNSELAIKTYDYNVIDIVSALAQGECGGDMETSRTTVIFWPSSPGVVDSMTVDETTLKILDLCRGKMTVGDIAKRFQNKRSRRPVMTDEAVRERLHSWLRQGVIRLEDESCKG